MGAWGSFLLLLFFGFFYLIWFEFIFPLFTAPPPLDQFRAALCPCPLTPRSNVLCSVARDVFVFGRVQFQLFFWWRTWREGHLWRVFEARKSKRKSSIVIYDGLTNPFSLLLLSQKNSFSAWILTASIFGKSCTLFLYPQTCDVGKSDLEIYSFINKNI